MAFWVVPRAARTLSLFTIHRVVFHQASGMVRCAMAVMTLPIWLDFAMRILRVIGSELCFSQGVMNGLASCVRVGTGNALSYDA